MERITQAHLEPLMHEENSWSVSLYMPTHQAGAETRQDPIRFKNLLGEAERQMAEAGLRPSEARSRLKGLRELREESRFWQHQNSGLAVFLAGKEPRAFSVPFPVEELAVVGDRFHLKPLMPLVAHGTRFYVLALSQNSVRLMAGTPHDIKPVPLKGAPRNMAEVLQNYDVEPHLQFHSGAAGGSQNGKQAVLFHGHGDARDAAQEKKRVIEFCRQVERGVRRRLGNEDVPLLLYAAEPLRGFYHEINSYPHLDGKGLQGNPDRLSPQEIHEAAVRAIAPVFREQKQRAVAEYHDRANGARASAEVEKITPAAHQGQVDTLLVTPGEHRWGRFDPEHWDVEVHESRQPGDQDLLDLAAVRTCATGGTVYAIERQAMPGDRVVAATLRYATSS